MSRTPAPDFHAATRKAREQLREAYRLFLYAYRAAAEALRRGDFTVPFPPDCFPPRVPAPDGPSPPT